MGYDFVPGDARRRARARARPASQAIRVDVGYYAFGAGISARTRRFGRSRSCSRTASRSASGALPDGRGSAERVRSFHVHGKDSRRVSVGGSEHLTLPASSIRDSTEVNVYLGWFAALGAAAPGGQPGRLGRAARARRARGAEGRRGPARDVGSRCARARLGDPVGRRRGLRRGGEPARGGAPVRRRAVRAHRGHPGLGGAPRSRARASKSTGALGPVEAFGLRELGEPAAREAGLERVSEQPLR